MVWSFLLGLFSSLFSFISNLGQLIGQGIATFWDILPRQIKTIFAMIIIFASASVLDALVEITFDLFNQIFIFFGYNSFSITPSLFGIDLRFPYNCGTQICYIGFFKGIAIILILFLLVKLAIDVSALRRD